MAKQFLAGHPLCVACAKANRVKPSAVVDHIQAHKGDMGLFWDINNWQALCKQCHDKKTAAEEGRWG
jgi:5-methylcytosine-specific restriction protein A